MTTKRKAPQPSDRPISDRGVHGEGNYRASREYNEATRRFVKSGKVQPAADGAAPKSQEEADQMMAAERAGRARGRGEDPVDPVPAKPGRRSGSRND
jgi:hypothetical protein